MKLNLVVCDPLANKRCKKIQGLVLSPSSFRIASSFSYTSSAGVEIRQVLLQMPVEVMLRSLSVMTRPVYVEGATSSGLVTVRTVRVCPVTIYEFA